MTDYWAHYWFSGVYRPVTTLSFRLERNTLGFGRDPRGYVAVNLVLHLAVTLAVWRLGRRWIGPGPGAFLAAALFAVHPVTTEVVPNVVGRADLFAALGALGALHAWERSDGPDGLRWRWIAAGAWLLALLAKESPITLPAALLLRDAALARPLFAGGPRAARSRLVPRYVPLVVAGGAWAAIRYAMLSPYGLTVIRSIENPLVIEPPLPRILTGLTLLGDDPHGGHLAAPDPPQRQPHRDSDPHRPHDVPPDPVRNSAASRAPMSSCPRLTAESCASAAWSGRTRPKPR